MSEADQHEAIKLINRLQAEVAELKLKLTKLSNELERQTVYLK